MLESLLWNFMLKNCHGYRSALTGKEIRIKMFELYNLDISDRLFRRIMSDWKHDGFNGEYIASHPSLGYWIAKSDTPEELNAHIDSWQDMRSRAMDMLTDCDKRIKTLTDKINQKADLFV